MSRSASQGLTCRSYARSKQSLYADLCTPGVCFVPCIADVFGFLDAPFVSYMRALARSAVLRSQPQLLQSGDSEQIAAASSRQLHRWLLRLSVALQRSVASQIMLLSGQALHFHNTFPRANFRDMFDFAPRAAF